MNILEQVRFEKVKTRDITMRIAVLDHTDGKGPMVLMLHGWPESWYSWRHQMTALADAGFRVIAPDMPGFGGTDRLANEKDYNIITISENIIGLLDALGEDRVMLAGHDWGAVVAWDLVKLFPGRFSKLANLSVPFRARGEISPMVAAKNALGDRFFYQLYFQLPEIPEAELDADPEGILRRLYCSPDTPRENPEITDSKMDAGGWIGRMGAPKAPVDWFSEADLAYYVAEYTRAGFHGGINYYRNIDRNWELMAPYAEQTIDMPVLFMAGEKDFVIGRATEEQLTASMKIKVPNLTEVKVLAGIGHWIQQEAAEVVSEKMVDFFSG